MTPDILEEYVSKVYAYAMKRTFSNEEAADLSQEILCTAVRELPRLRDESRFAPWFWGIADNVTKSFRRNLGKQRAMFSYGIPEDLALEEEEDPAENEAMYAALRQKIAMLSAMYRDILILHYYDGLSTKQISARLGIPEGTVTWRLSEARRKLKKEYDHMDERALRPAKLRLDIYGEGNFDGKKVPFPYTYINDALSQNILCSCYEEALGVEDLAKICGVPAYYIEDRLNNLLRREAIVETPKGKYRTNFVIWSDKYGIYCEENAEKALLPILGDMIAALKSLAAEAGGIDFYKAEKSEADLLYLYGMLALHHVKPAYCSLPYPPMQEKYDGFRWCYLGNTESGRHRRIGINTLCCSNIGSRGHYTHTVYTNLPGFSGRDMMMDNRINACEDILTTGKTDDVDAAALAIQDGYIVKRADGSFFVTVPAFTLSQKAELDRLAEKHLAPVMPEYTARAEKFIAGYKKLFPKHLQNDADRLCSGMFTGLYQMVIGYGQRTGALTLPTPGSFCDVLLQFKE